MYDPVISLNTDILPGKNRDTFLEAQTRKIADAINTIGRQILAEAPLPSVSGLNNLYTLANSPIRGQVAMYNAGLRVDPSTYSVHGRVVTILTASITGLVFFDYRW